MPSHDHQPPRPAGEASPRILLLGGNGQLGWELSRSLLPLGELVISTRGGEQGALPLDLADADAIRALVRQVRPQLIVNAAAYTAVDRAEQETAVAHAANAVAPGVLAEEARALGAALVHYSTDYVFDGSGQQPWTERDEVSPLNVYGRSKEAGERAIRAVGVPHLILRTSWVYGVHGNNFVKTMLRLGAERSLLRVVCDQHGAPTSARALADLTAQILAQARGDLAAFCAELGGTFHACCGGETTWHGFATAIFEMARNLGTPLEVRDVQAIRAEEYPTPARRPHNSRLNCQKLQATFGLAAADWRTSLHQCLDELLTRRAPAASSPQVASAAPPRPANVPLPATLPLTTFVAAKAEPPIDLDIGVIYTHERYWLPRLLSSLAQSAGDLNVRVLLVDNVSEGWDDQWARLVKSISILRNENRLGYADNLNRILQASTAPFTLLLNTDMSFDPAEQCLSKMVAFMREHPRCGVAGCRLYHPDGTYGFPARRFQKLSTIAARRTPLAPLMRSTARHYLYCDRPHTDQFACDWLSGCFLLVRREAYAEVGGFDSGFRKYFEDVDFCLRMTCAGWEVMFNGDTYAYHYEQRASKRLLSRDAWQHLQSYARWLKKWGFSVRRAA